MNDYATIQQQSSTHNSLDDLENLEYSLNILIEKHKALKSEKERLEDDYSSLNQHYQKLLVKHQKIEQRIQTLLGKLVQLDV